MTNKHTEKEVIEFSGEEIKQVQTVNIITENDAIICVQTEKGYDCKINDEWLQAERQLAKQEEHAKIIVDLYEIRASVSLPMQARQIEKIENVGKYNFFSSVIATLYDKYKVSEDLIQKEIRNRKIQEDILTLSNTQ